MALGAGPFGTWERTVAWRYLRNKRKNGRRGGDRRSSRSSAVMLAVFVLITVMSVMNGFRAELLGRLLGFNGHVYAQGPLLNGPDRDGVISRIKAVRGVTQAAPMVEAQAMVVGLGLDNRRGLVAPPDRCRVVRAVQRAGPEPGPDDREARRRPGAKPFIALI